MRYILQSCPKCETSDPRIYHMEATVKGWQARLAFLTPHPEGFRHQCQVCRYSWFVTLVDMRLKGD